MDNILKKYWIRGGIISSSITTIIYTLGHFGDRIFILDYLYEVKDIIQFIAGVAFCGFMDADGLLGSCKFLSNSSYSGFLAFFVPLLLSIILFFIIGSVIGWIYGKLKTNRTH